MTSNAAFRYQVGGALLQDVPSYVTRESDRQLFEALKAGEFCYVLNSRQMGKSSLMVRTLAQLQAEGWKGIILDFSAKGSQSDRPNLWYNGIINDLNKDFQLLERKNFLKWLKERDYIAPVERLGEFIETVLLPGIIQPIAIFVDEIDSTLGLPFTDDFFALIRACYNKRAEKPDYKRLTFALLGVAAPSDLIGDTKRTPFNIGKGINLSGFTLAEAQPLAEGLAEKSANPQAVLKEILYWTGGQPFLSQRLCQLVADSRDNLVAGSEASVVERLVRSHLIENWESQDQQSHLKTISERILDNERKAAYLLELYRQTRQAGSLPVQNRPEEQELQLSGIVVKRNGSLQIYNPIYEAVFDESWIDAELGKLRPYAENFRAWVLSGKTDKSRLLRGDALKEAEQWAREKNPSGEDRDFLSASRTQEREEEIIVKEREAELERERKNKELAEKANKQLRQRTLIGTAIGSVILATALIVAGFFAAKAKEEVEIANRAKEEAALAKEEAALATQKAAQKETEVKGLNQKLASQKIELNKAEKEVAKKQAEASRAEEDAKLANQKAQQAENEVQKAQQNLVITNQKNEELLQEAEQLKLQAQDAKKKAEEARQAREKADNALKIAQKKQQEIADNNKTVDKLSNLIADLYGSGKPEDEKQPEAAEDAIKQIGLSFTDFTDNKPEFKKALLKSSIALAYLRLDPQDKEKKAQTAIEESLKLIKNNPDLFKSEKGKPIAFFSYAVLGNLLEEQNPKGVPPAYEKAFSYAFGDATQWFNLGQDVKGAYRSLLGKVNRDNFRALATASLKKHYEFREKQAIQELDLFLEGKAWEKADRATNDAIFASVYSKSLNFSWENLSCSSLKKIDDLWSKHSAGRFGFKVQKEIWQKNGSPNLNSPDEMWRKFYIEIGWKTEESGVKSWEGMLEYEDLMGFKDVDKASRGNLPRVCVRIGYGYCMVKMERELRTVTCNI